MRTQSIFSVSSLELQSLKANANALKKRDGLSHSHALEQVAREIGLPSWRVASTLLRLPFAKNEFHRILVNRTILVLYWIESYYTPRLADLVINGYTLPEGKVNRDRMELCFIGGCVGRCYQVRCTRRG